MASTDLTEPAIAVATDAIPATEWCPRADRRAIALADVPLATGIVCFEVTAGADPSAVFEILAPFCGPGLQFEMVVDLLQPDELPKVEDHEGQHVRAVSAFGVTAHDPPDA